MVLNLYNIQVQNHHFPQCIYLCDISPIDWRSFNQLHTEKWTKAFYQLCSYIFVGSYVFFFSRISFDETELPINQMSEYQNCTNFTNIKIFKISEGWNKQKYSLPMAFPPTPLSEQLFDFAEYKMCHWHTCRKHFSLHFHFHCTYEKHFWLHFHFHCTCRKHFSLHIVAKVSNKAFILQ